MKFKLISLILVLLMTLMTLTACDNKTEASEPNPFQRRFQREFMGDHMYVITDKVTGVCYFAYIKGDGLGVCEMVDADGTPLTYAEAWEQAFGEGHP